MDDMDDRSDLLHMFLHVLTCQSSTSPEFTEADYMQLNIYPEPGYGKRMH